MAETKAAVIGITVDDPRVAQLFDLLDQRDAQRPPNNKRTESRYPFRQTVIVELRQTEGSCSTIIAPSRNISRWGISMLFPGFVHCATRCRSRLVTTHQNVHEVDGSVRWCRYLQGRFHDVGVRFDQPIDVPMFCAQAVARRILIIDDDESIARLLTHHLKRLNVDVTVAKNGADGIEQAMNQLFDCILMEMEMPGMTGAQTMAELRKRGYLGKVVALTALSGPEDERMIREGRFYSHLKKPFTRKAIDDMIASLADEPIFSSLAAETSMHELINQFVTELVAKCRTFEQALAATDFEQLERLARRLKGEAGGYGFDALTESAEKLERLIQSKTPLDQIEKQVCELSDLCRLVRPIAT